MKLKKPFYQLPIKFDVDRLQQEVLQFGVTAWQDHPQAFSGNSVVHFVTVGGTDNDIMLGSMASTKNLNICPYIQQILAQFNTPIGRCRLMILAPGATVPEHTDVHYYWRNRVRIHIPIFTQPEIRFYCDHSNVHMALGEAWIFDNWRIHKVINNTDTVRIHLVIDTVGSASFWHLVESAQSYQTLNTSNAVAAELVAFEPDVKAGFAIEKAEPMTFMHPSEVQQWCGFINEQVIITDDNQAAVKQFQQTCTDFHVDWRAIFISLAEDKEGLKQFRDLIERTKIDLAVISEKPLLLSNQSAANKVFLQWTEACINISSNQNMRTLSVMTTIKPSLETSQSDTEYKDPLMDATAIAVTPKKRLMDSPIFIVAAPRSGSTLLFETLACATAIMTIGGESHEVFENIASFDPSQRGFSSNRLTCADVNKSVVSQLNVAFIKLMKSSKGKPYLLFSEQERSDLKTAYFLEKTPKNSLRIEFLKAAYPQARFIYLHRNPRDNISSIIDAWRSGRFATYRNLPQWTGLPWSLLLTPGWRAYIGKPVEEVAAHQWHSANQHILNDLAKLTPQDWCEVDYDEFIKAPEQQVKNICDFIGIEFDNSLSARVSAKLPASRYTLSAPKQDKWRANEKELSTVLPLIEPVAKKLNYDYSL